MDPKALVTILNSFLGNIIFFLKEILVGVGIDPDKVGSVLNMIGLFTAGFITVMIVTVGIISYIKGTQYEPFYSSYEDDAFVRGKAGTIMGILTIVCAVWFLFAIVYIYFVG